MTGFGRAVLDAPFGKLTVEIQSVNRKYLEVSVSMPKEFGRFEQEVRKWVSEFVSRGQVFIRILLAPKGVGQLLPDIKSLKEFKEGWEAIARELGTSPEAIDLPFLMQYLPSQASSDLVTDENLSFLHKAVDLAVESLVKMKKMEGKTLGQDLLNRLKELERLIGEVEKLTPDATKKMKQKLLEKMAEVLQPAAELDERLLREVALFAERVDVTEEIIRFRSHLAQFHTLLNEQTVGRKMDFLIQEIGREVNTIGSKSMEAKIAYLVVEMKSELEKMREQIQNIE